MKGSSVAAFRAASSFLVEAVRAVSAADWDRAGLGDWSVLELVAHAYRGFSTVEEYLLHPRLPEPMGSEYFSARSIAERARDALAALGDDPANAVARCANSVDELVSSAAQDATIGSPAGTMSLAAYLPSRTAELTIHGIDLVRAVGLTALQPPNEAVLESLSFTARRAVTKGDGELLLLATSGRGQLPAGFSVY